MDSKEIYYENASTETQKMEENRDGRQFDLSVAASGHGGGYCCDTGVDLPTLLALLAGKKTLMTNNTIHQLYVQMVTEMHYTMSFYTFHFRNCSCNVLFAYSNSCLNAGETTSADLRYYPKYCNQKRIGGF